MSIPKRLSWKTSLMVLAATVSVGSLSLVFAKDVRGNSNTASPGQNQTLIAQNSQNSIKLDATAGKGTPEGFTEQEWLQANAEVYVSDIQENSYEITIEASNLVPNGLYTVWWVENQLVGMDMGPAGGTPENEFRADEQGNATKTVTVPKGNDYDMLGIAYHADDQTHGDTPGKMGEVSFRHLMGNFIKPN